MGKGYATPDKVVNDAGTARFVLRANACRVTCPGEGGCKIMRNEVVQLVTLVAFACAVTSAFAAAPESLAGKAIHLELIETYTADSAFHGNRRIEGRFPVRRVRLPFRRYVARLLGYAGVRGVSDANSEVGPTLTIVVHGVALGQVYDLMVGLQRRRNLRFNGARLDGEIAFGFVDAPAYVARFSGAVVPSQVIPVSSRHDHREDAVYAPFEEAFDQSGSFIATFTAMVGEIYGPGPLVAALRDTRAEVARHAAAALDRLGRTGLHCGQKQ